MKNKTKTLVIMVIEKKSWLCLLIFFSMVIEEKKNRAS